MSSTKEIRTSRAAVAAVLGAAIVPLTAAAAHPPHQMERGAMAAGDKSQQDGGHAVTNLPYARGRSFGTLDEYLAFRRKGGALDLPWYREVRPGLYRLETGNLRAAVAERFYTREELERKFGFER